MTATERQRRNLKRGGIQGTAESAARARAAKAKNREAEAHLRELAVCDPQAASLELHADLVVGVRKLTRSWLKSGDDPSRQLIEAWRELRMLTDRVLEYLREQGPTHEASAFFATLDERLQGMAERLSCESCGSPFEPHPVIEVPTDRDFSE